MRHHKGLTSLLLLAGLAAAPALAEGTPQTPASRGSVLNLNSASGQGGPFAHRGGALPPVISALQAEGIKFVSIGEEDGMRAYLGEAANGRFQAFYPTPDGEHVVVGLMFEPGGANVTSRQVGRMLRRFNSAATSVPGIDAGAIQAIPEDPKAPQDPGKPFIDWMREQGMKATPFLDRDGGLDGYLVETKGVDGAPGKMQPFYVFPDKRRAVAGVLIRRGGVFVTGLQIHALQQRYMSDEAAKSQDKFSTVVPGSANPPAPPEMLGEGAATAAPAPVGTVSPTAKAEPASQPPAQAPAAAEPAKADPAKSSGIEPVTAPVQATEATKTASEPALPEPGTEAAVRPVMAAQAPAPADASPLKPVMPEGPISPKPPEAAAPYLVDATDRAQFLEAVKQTVWFAVGMKGAPAIYMVADPQCPFCHETWRRVKQRVFDGKMQVRVILIAGLKGSDPYVRSILARGEPTGAGASTAWLQGEGSINNVPIQPPPADGTPANEMAKRFVSYNAAFAQRFQVSRTPFMFYTTPEGKLYASVGIPDDLDGFLAAVR